MSLLRDDDTHHANVIPGTNVIAFAREERALARVANDDVRSTRPAPQFRHIAARRLQQFRCVKRWRAWFGASSMKRLLTLGWLVAIAMLPFSHAALAQRAKYEELITTHAKANLVPEDLVHRVIIRESKYQAALLGSGGAIGLMQIKLATARSLGYTGTAEGLRDPATNLMYGIKYLAGAFRAANGNHDRAVHYYAAGYYFAEKHQRLEHLKEAKSGPSTAPPKVEAVAAVKDDTSARDGAKDVTEAKSETAAGPAPAPQAGDSGVKAR